MIVDVKITAWWMHLGSRLERAPGDYPASIGRGVTIVGTTHLADDTRAYAHVSLHQGMSAEAAAASCVGFVKAKRPIDVILDGHLGVGPALWQEVGEWLRAAPGVAFLKLWLPDGTTFAEEESVPVLDFEMQMEFKAAGRR